MRDTGCKQRDTQYASRTTQYEIAECSEAYLGRLIINRSKLISCLNVVMVGVVLLAIFSLILKYGFYLSNETKTLLYQLYIFIAGIFVAEFFLKLALSRERKRGAGGESKLSSPPQ